MPDTRLHLIDTDNTDALQFCNFKERRWGKPKQFSHEQDSLYMLNLNKDGIMRVSSSLELSQIQSHKKVSSTQILPEKGQTYHHSYIRHCRVCILPSSNIRNPRGSWCSPAHSRSSARRTRRRLPNTTSRDTKKDELPVTIRLPAHRQKTYKIM